MSSDDRMRQACLNEHLFGNLRHTRFIIAAWRTDLNHYRPHTSLAEAPIFRGGQLGGLTIVAVQFHEVRVLRPTGEDTPPS